MVGNIYFEPVCFPSRPHIRLGLCFLHIFFRIWEFRPHFDNKVSAVICIELVLLHTQSKLFIEFVLNLESWEVVLQRVRVKLGNTLLHGIINTGIILKRHILHRTLITRNNITMHLHRRSSIDRRRRHSHRGGWRGSTREYLMITAH